MMDESNSLLQNQIQNPEVKVEKADYYYDEADIKVDIDEYMPWLQEPSTDWTIDSLEEDSAFTIITSGETLKNPLLCKCVSCGKRFGNTYSLLEHNLDHLNVPLNRCDNNQPAIKQTKPRMPNTTKRIHKCDVCKQLFTYRTWHTHMREVHTAYTFPCNKCSKIFTCQRYYKRHLQFVHEGVPRWMPSQPVKCEFCDAVFKHKSPLTTHVRNVHSTPVKCEICCSVLKSKSYLQGHMLRVHFDDGKKHACLICGKSFKSPRYVNIHMKNNHKMEGRNAKNVNKRSSDILKKRKGSNRKMQKDFKCDLCVKTFCNKYSLNNHELKFHATENKRELKLEHEGDVENTLFGDSLKYDVVVREIKIEEM